MRDPRKIVEAAIGAIARNEGTATEGAVRDALTELRHLCDRQGLDFAAIDAAAYSVYCEESVDARVERRLASRKVL